MDTRMIITRASSLHSPARPSLSLAVSSPVVLRMLRSARLVGLAAEAELRSPALCSALRDPLK
ncbi:UNVERIFIED_CONTAM: hypothetical protein FKN15_010644 [Acipenser sinensis]